MEEMESQSKGMVKRLEPTIAADEAGFDLPSPLATAGVEL